MPLFVRFSRRFSTVPGLPEGPGQVNEVEQTLGPYRVVEIVGDALMVSEAFQPFTLATRDAAALWTVNGLDGLAFTHVNIRPPAAQCEADLDAAEEQAEEDDDD